MSNLPVKKKYSLDEKLLPQIKGIKDTRKTIDKIQTAFNRQLGKALHPTERRKGLWPALVSVYHSARDSLSAKYEDPFEMIGPAFAELIERQIGVVTTACHSAQTLETDLETVKEELDRAEAEHWTYEQYLNYLSDTTHVQLSEEVLDLLRSPTFIPGSMRLQSISSIRKGLEGSIEVGKRIYLAMGKCTGILVLKLGDTMAKARGYAVNAPAAAAIRDMSEVAGRSVYTEGVIDEGFLQVLEQSSTLMGYSIRAMQLSNQYGLTGPRGIQRLTTAVIRLEDNIKSLISPQQPKSEVKALSEKEPSTNVVANSD
jgi:hypothetical protein